MVNNCDVCEALKYNKYVLFETDYWMVSLASDQFFLGRSYITAKQHTSSLSELSAEQWNDLHKCIKKYEKSVAMAFGAALFNWACLMNDAFKNIKEPQSPHVHFHVRPRYKDKVIFKNIEFNDVDFGKHYKTLWDGASKVILDDNIMREIQKSIQRI